ncbi:hypothetical protein T484DRAFT_3620486 [Baffinella frigidus]|nr:hypothetical protein T484DRAFT_3620486 [Cryptophyta sp. CCMP2293]
MRSVARASQVRVVRTAAGALLFATLCVSSATGFSVPHVGTGLHPRAARCPAVMSAQTSDNVDSGYGDKALKSAAFALGEGQIKWARRLCARARQEYKITGVNDREPLLIAIERRVDKEQDPKPPVVAPTIASELANRLLMTRQEGDTFLYEASLALGAREFLKARMLVEEARASFKEAGEVVFREREQLVVNLIQYVMAEEERQEKMRRTQAKALKKVKEQSILQQRFYLCVYAHNNHKKAKAAGETQKGR